MAQGDGGSQICCDRIVNSAFEHDGESVRALLVPIEMMGPMDLLHLDLTKIEVSGDHAKGVEEET